MQYLERLIGKLRGESKGSEEVSVWESDKRALENAGVLTLLNNIEAELRKAGDSTVLISENNAPYHYTVSLYWDLRPASEKIQKSFHTNWQSKRIEIGLTVLKEINIMYYSRAVLHTLKENRRYKQFVKRQNREPSLEESVRFAMAAAYPRPDYRGEEKAQEDFSKRSDV